MAKVTDMDTIMIKKSGFVLDPEKKVEWIKEAEELLHEFSYDTTESAIGKVLDAWASTKGWLVELFRKSEYYNGNGQIVIPAHLKRPVDRDKISEFSRWVNKEFSNKIVREKELKIGLFTLVEYEEYADKVYDIWRSMRPNSTYNGLTKEGWEREYRRRKDVIRERTKECGYRSVYLDYTTHYVSCKNYEMINNFRYLINELVERTEEVNLIKGDVLKKVNMYAEALGLKAKAAEGQKTTKFVGKVLRELGLNHVVDIQKTRWYDNNGNLHEREKDMGYNYWFAALGDAINPMDYEREVVISVNPFDYWTMSFGYKWASCHTIDKFNTRRAGSDNYSGCYSGGTESYMLDESSIIMYVRPTEEELSKVGDTDKPLELQSKLKRVVFYLGEDKLVQSRVYPDGRDGGDEGIATQLREIMQATIASLYETPNLWTLKKGGYECSKVIDTQSNVHYADYDCCPDCNVSYLRRINGNLNSKMIRVGSDIICPNCGDTHDCQEHITCDYCYDSNIICCERCGQAINLNTNSNYIEVDDRYYCCERCCEIDNYVYTEDDGWHHIDDCSRDAYDDCWYYYDDDHVYVDGYWYCCSENAEADGWRWCEPDNGWYAGDDTEELVSGDYFYKYDHEDAVETDDGWYLSPEDAEENGWTLNEDDEWVRAA